MNTIETLRRMEELTNHYLHELQNFSMEQLKLQPSENEWSLGQMYLHLINSAFYMQLRNIEDCRMGQADSVVMAGTKTEPGEAVFAQGSLPPIRIQVPPSPQYTPRQPVSKEEVVEGLHTVLVKMKEIEPALNQISPLHTVAHPRFGALNATEWFVLVEMHYRHHLHQMGRLVNFVESVSTKTNL